MQDTASLEEIRARYLLYMKQGDETVKYTVWYNQILRANFRKNRIWNLKYEQKFYILNELTDETV
jgi:hypothetical protein